MHINFHSRVAPECGRFGLNKQAGRVVREGMFSNNAEWVGKKLTSQTCPRNVA